MAVKRKDTCVGGSNYSFRLPKDAAETLNKIYQNQGVFQYKILAAAIVAYDNLSDINQLILVSNNDKRKKELLDKISKL